MVCSVEARTLRSRLFIVLVRQALYLASDDHAIRLSVNEAGGN